MFSPGSSVTIQNLLWNSPICKLNRIAASGRMLRVYAVLRLLRQAVAVAGPST